MASGILTDQLLFITICILLVGSAICFLLTLIHCALREIIKFINEQTDAEMDF